MAGMAVYVHQFCFSVSQDTIVTFGDMRRPGTSRRLKLVDDVRWVSMRPLMKAGALA